VTVRVIINEPNALMRGVLRDALEEDDFEVVAECAGPEETLEAAARIEVDLLITNLLMSGSIDGIGLTAQLHADRPQLPVFILTASDRPEYLARARAAGARGYLKKGSDLETLLAAPRS
jgi:two-component system, NarL family, response regulator DesR